MMDLPPDVEKALPGVAGSLTALAFLRESLGRLVVLFVAGAVFAHYTGPVFERSLGPRLAGYFAGIFGMAIVAKVFQGIAAFDAPRAGRELWLTVLALIKRRRP